MISLGSATLRDLIKYYYKEKVVGLGTMSKHNLVGRVVQLFTKQQHPV
jgi:hypothetical protein